MSLRSRALFTQHLEPDFFFFFFKQLFEPTDYSLCWCVAGGRVWFREWLKCGLFRGATLEMSNAGWKTGWADSPDFKPCPQGADWKTVQEQVCEFAFWKLGHMKLKSFGDVSWQAKSRAKKAHKALFRHNDITEENRLLHCYHDCLF